MYGRMVRGLALVGVFGCTDPATVPPENGASNEVRLDFGARCNVHGVVECDEGECTLLDQGSTSLQICTRTCSADRDCEGAAPHCGVAPDGRSLCLPKCEEAPEGYACIDGKTTACNQVTSSACRECGCEAALTCDEASGNCVARVSEGEVCVEDDDCDTGNCSSIFGVCFMPVGAPCQAGDRCETCYQDGDWSFCSRACDADRSCNGHHCISYDEVFVVGSCRPNCFDGCPGDCNRLRNDSSTSICDFDDAEVAWAARPLGADCDADEQCEAICHRYFYVGYCSTSCTTDAECGGGACVNLPCAADQSDSIACGNLCLPRCAPEDPEGCTEDHCLAYPSAETGTEVSVCNPLGAEGEICLYDYTCLSGRCVGSYCAPAFGSTPNGEACTVGDDCRSGQCIEATCRGTALLGEACTSDPDCAVGTCCGGACCSE